MIEAGGYLTEKLNRQGIESYFLVHSLKSVGLESWRGESHYHNSARWHWWSQVTAIIADARVSNRIFSSDIDSVLKVRLWQSTRRSVNADWR